MHKKVHILIYLFRSQYSVIRSLRYQENITLHYLGLCCNY